MEASIAVWRAMRACHHSACARRASAGQAAPASRGICHSSQVSPRAALGGALRFERALRVLPQHVDLGVVGDGFQGDVRRAVVDEALPQVTLGGRIGRLGAGELRFLGAPLAAIGQQVIGVARGHQPGARQGKGDAGRVDGDPPSSPLLRHGGGGAGAAGGVEHKIAWVGGHEDAAADYLSRRLNDVAFCLGEPGDYGVFPRVGDRNIWKVIRVALVTQTFP